MPTAELECRALSFERDDMPVFEGLSFSLSAGQLMQVLGANGAGKTTLLRMLATVLTPSAGDIWWRGRPLTQSKEDYLAQMLYLGHQPGIKQELSPAENLAWLLRLNPAAGEQAMIADVLARMGLSGYEDVPARQLSAGQQRRIALARLHLSRAPLWILDEPFTAIDRSGVAALEALMAEHLRAGGLIVLSTHQPLGLRDNVTQLDLAQYAQAA